VKLILDFDGTLLDSMPRLARHAEETINAYFDVPDAYDAYMSCVGLSFKEQLREIWPPDTVDEELEIEDCTYVFLDLQKKVYETAELHTGVQEELKFLLHERIHFAICTSSHATLVTKVFDRLNLGFTPLVYGIEYGPKSDQLKTLKDKGYGVFIGDTPRDGQLAQEAGLDFVGVEHTFPRHVFKDADLFSCIDIHEAVTEALRGPPTWPHAAVITYTSKDSESSLWPARAA
jgi:phosphoglycolate phosphatase-like HAD superfamily hydrolase